MPGFENISGISYGGEFQSKDDLQKNGYIKQIFAQIDRRNNTRKTYRHGWFSPGSRQHNSQAFVGGSFGPGMHWQDSNPYARQMLPVHSYWNTSFAHVRQIIFVHLIRVRVRFLIGLISTPMKQTNSRLQMVLLGLLMDGGQYGERPSQKLASRQPLSSLHLSPKRRLHSPVQHGPWKGKQTEPSKLRYVIRTMRRVIILCISVSKTPKINFTEYRLN